MKFIAFSFVFVAFFSCANAQIVSGVDAELAFEQLYNFNFEAADSIAEFKLGQDPQSAYWNLVSAYVAWSQILAGKMTDENWNDRFDKDIGKAKEILKESKLDSDDVLFAFIIVNAFKTRHELLNDNYLSAAKGLNTCIDQISASFGKEKGYEPFYLTAGLYYYFMWLAREEYFWLRPYLLLYPEGKKELGLRYLHRVTQSDDVFLKNESLYFLMRIYFDLEKNYSVAKKYVDELVELNPNNLIYRLFQYRIVQKLNVGKSENYRLDYIKRVRSMTSLNSVEKQHFINEIDAEDN